MLESMLVFQSPPGELAGVAFPRDACRSGAGADPRLPRSGGPSDPPPRRRSAPPGAPARAAELRRRPACTTELSVPPLLSAPARAAPSEPHFPRCVDVVGGAGLRRQRRKMAATTGAGERAAGWRGRGLGGAAPRRGAPTAPAGGGAAGCRRPGGPAGCVGAGGAAAAGARPGGAGRRGEGGGGGGGGGGAGLRGAARRGARCPAGSGGGEGPRRFVAVPRRARPAPPRGLPRPGGGSGPGGASPVRGGDGGAGPGRALQEACRGPLRAGGGERLWPG